jgi:hypothetical protein
LMASNGGEFDSKSRGTGRDGARFIGGRRIMKQSGASVTLPPARRQLRGQRLVAVSDRLRVRWAVGFGKRSRRSRRSGGRYGSNNYFLTVINFRQSFEYFLSYRYVYEFFVFY